MSIICHLELFTSLYTSYTGAQYMCLLALVKKHVAPAVLTNNMNLKRVYRSLLSKNIKALRPKGYTGSLKR